MKALKVQYTKSDTKNEKKEDDVEDNFISNMEEFIQDAISISTELLNSFNKSIKNIIDLAISYGEKKNVTVEEFFKIWTDFLISWGKAREAIRKRVAAEKKKQKLLEKKQKLKAKLENRASKQVVKKKGIIKSK